MQSVRSGSVRSLRSGEALALLASTPARLAASALQVVVVVVVVVLANGATCLYEAEPGEGEGEAAVATCQERCTEDAQCNAGGVGGDLCVAERCTTPPASVSCVTSEECVAGLTANRACTSDLDCPARFVCMDLDGTPGGAGECELRPVNGACEIGQMFDIRASDGAVTAMCGPARACVGGVCGEASCRADADCVGGGRCRADGVCTACLNDGDCPGAGATRCIEQTFCGCASDAYCEADGQPANCRSDGICGCVVDDDCAWFNGWDRCIGGTCGCDGVNDCADYPTRDGLAIVCE